MSIGSFTHRSTVLHEDIAGNVRNLVADHLGIGPERVSGETHLLNDLGADWLDRLELLIVLEDQYGLEFADDAVDEIVIVANLIRFVETHRRR